MRAKRMERTDIIYALVDCNNFYASCERLFNPKLNGKPIVVLSNNDGVIVARSNEAKALGIEMAVPVFKAKNIIEKNNVHVFSSNYTLYGDMSRRVFDTLRMFSPEVEIYSIDEAFMNLFGCDRLNQFEQLQKVESNRAIYGRTTLEKYGRLIKDTVQKWTGIPVSVGIARTKVLAKAANRLAKKSPRAGGVLDLVDSPYLEQALENIEVGDIWGVGHQSKKKLKMRRINNALQLRNADEKVVRNEMGVNGVRLVKELNGVSCMELDHCPQPRKSTTSSRSFGREVESIEELREAVASFISIAAQKLRSEKLAAKYLSVYILTNSYKTDAPQYNKSVSIKLPVATNDTSVLIKYAGRCLAKIYRKGYKYKKAGVLFTELVPADKVQADLFSKPRSKKSQALMETLDDINDKMGSGTLIYATQGLRKNWKMRSASRTPNYTTRWDSLLEVG